MALNLKDDATHDLARKLATATGESLAKAVRTAIEERLARVERSNAGSPAELVRRLDSIAAHCGSLPVEPERHDLNRRIAADPVRLLSVANYLETAIIIDDRFGEAGGRDLRHLLFDASVRVVAVTIEQAELARTAYRLFGKGNHPARLN